MIMFNLQVTEMKHDELTNLSSSGAGTLIQELTSWPTNKNNQAIEFVLDWEEPLLALPTW